MPASVITHRRAAPIGKPVPLAVGAGTCIGWWSSDFGVFQNTAMTTPSVANGAVVQGWQDQSGLGHHLLQSTTANAPTLQNSVVNGKSTVRFDGTNDLLQALFTLDIPFDLFLLTRTISWVEGATLAAGGVGDNFSLYQHSATPGIDIYNGATTGAHNTGMNVGSLFRLAEAGMPSGASCYTQVNNNAAVTGGTPASAARGGLTLAAHPGPSAWCNVEFAEAVLYSSILSSGDATSLRSYFTGRYAVP